MAQLLAGRADALRIDPGGLHEFVEAAWPDVLPDCPYAVYLADEQGKFWTLAVDLDLRRGCDLTHDVLALERDLGQAGIRFVKAASGTGVHLLATFTDGVEAEVMAAVARALRDLAPSLDLTMLTNPHTGVIRPPGSPHRRGGRSLLMTPPTEALRILRQANDPALLESLLAEAPAAFPPAPRAARPLAARPARALSPVYRSLQRHGDPDAADRSAVAARICLAYVNAGLQEADFLAAALDRSNAGLDHLRRARTGAGAYRARSVPGLKAACRRMWAGRLRYAEQHPARGGTDAAVVAVVEGVLEAMQAEPRRWGGQAGPADAAILLAFCKLVRQVGQLAVSPGVRLLAESAGVTRSTAARAVQRLERDGWLALHQAAVGVLAAAYQIQVPVRAPQGGAGLASQLRRTARDLERLCAVLAHDVSTSAGLGRYAGAVLARIATGSRTVEELAGGTGLALRTVRRHLARLDGLGLADRAVRGRDLTDTAFDELAQALGAQGTVARRRELHADERLAWRWLTADHTARRGWTHERGLYRAGRQSLVGRADATPSMPFPRRQGRADLSLGLSLVRAGEGADPVSVQRVLVGPPTC